MWKYIETLKVIGHLGKETWAIAKLSSSETYREGPPTYYTVIGSGTAFPCKVAK